jgi:hypothetical protein
MELADAPVVTFDCKRRPAGGIPAGVLRAVPRWPHLARRPPLTSPGRSRLAWGLLPEQQCLELSGCARGAGSRASGGCVPIAVIWLRLLGMPPAAVTGQRSNPPVGHLGAADSYSATRSASVSTLSTIVCAVPGLGRTDPFDEGARQHRQPQGRALSRRTGWRTISSGVGSSSCGCVAAVGPGSRPVRRTGVADDEQCSAGCGRL